MKLEPELGLKIRMIFTVSLLIAIYLAFLAVMAYYRINLKATILFMGAFTFVQYYFSGHIVLWSMGAKEVSEKEAPELHSMVERLCLTANLPKPKIAIMKTEMPNAFATGRNQGNAVVVMTQGIMKQLDIGELEAVLAHELSHIKNRDMVAMTLATFLADVAYLVLRQDLSQINGDNSSGNDENPGGAIIIIAALWLISFLVYNISTLLILALSRYREFAADKGAAIITGKPSNLVSALVKISSEIPKISDSDLKMVKGANALFIIPAVKGKATRNFFSTHPSLEARIEALQCLGDEATIAYDKTIRIIPQFAEDWVNKGLALEDQCKYDEAIQAYDKAIELNSQSAEAWYNKGRVLYVKGKYDDAIQAYNKAIEIRPKDAEVWYNKGMALRLLGRVTEADAIFAQAKRDLNNKGNSLFDLEKYAEAINAYDLALTADPKYVNAWLNKGTAFFKLSRYDEAITAFDLVIKMNPKNADAWNRKGVVFKKMGRKVEASIAFAKAKELGS
ncbi:MAG: zinc metalloprotease HtpX [Methanotrichaceae archaeon]